MVWLHHLSAAGRGVTILLDAYLDKANGSDARPGFTTADITECDYILVAHSHWDHVWGAEKIAPRTGAKIIGSYKSIRLMAAAGVAEDQLWPVQGGETITLGQGISVKVFAAQHSCLWAFESGGNPDLDCIDGANVRYLERRGVEKDYIQSMFDFGGAVGDHMVETDQGCGGDGGALVYIIDTPEGRLMFQGSTGNWTGILETMRADVAILAASGRPNLDGEPWMGTLNNFLLYEARAMQARRVILCHHDAWMGEAFPRISIAPVVEAFAQHMPGCQAMEMDCVTALPLFDGLPDQVPAP